MGAPARPPAALGTAVGMTVALGAISVPLAWEHRHSPLPAVQWVRYVKQRYDPRRSAMVVTDHVPMVSLLAEDYAPDFQQSLVSLGEMSAVVASFEAQGRRVYATAPDPTAPQDWTPVACFARNPLLQSRGPWELWLYEHGGDPPARRPVCHTR